LFLVISTFGTPQAITTDEPRIEAFYPTNAKAAEFFQSLRSDEPGYSDTYTRPT
jgi:hypothetical protein